MASWTSECFQWNDGLNIMTHRLPVINTMRNIIYDEYICLEWIDD